MPFENGRPTVQQITPRLWVVVEALVYYGGRDVFVVPPGFRTDFASVPRAVVWLIPTYGRYTPAALLHDYLCVSARSSSPEATRRDADGLFRRCLREAGVSWPKRWIMWAGVRAASRMSGATGREWVQFVPAAVLGAGFVAVPGLVVQLWLLVWWLAEFVSWTVGRLLGVRRPAPPFDLTT